MTETLDQILDAFPDLIYVLDDEGRLLRWNRRVPDVTGYGDDEIASMVAPEFFVEADQEPIDEAIDEAVREGESRVEARVQPRDGEPVPYEFYSATTTTADGETVIVGVGRDISERRKRERSLERYRDLVELLPVGVYRATLGEDRRILEANPAMASIFGASDPGELEGRDTAPFYVRDEDRKELGRILEEEGIVRGLEIEIQALDGERRWIEVTSRVRDPGRPPTSQREQVGIVEDVTERVATRKELAELRREYETIIRNIKDSLWLVAVDGDDLRVKRFNPALEAVTGRGPEEVDGLPLQEAFGGTAAEGFVARAPERYRECIADREIVTFETSVEIDGDERRVEVRLTPVVEGGEVHEIVGSARDVTEARRYEERLRTQRDQMEILNRIIRHDIKNDMTAVVGLTETLLPEVSDEVRDDLERVRDTGQHVVNLTDVARNLVDVIRRGGDVEVAPTPLAETVTAEARNAARTYPDAEVALDDDLPDVDVQAGPLLGSVFRNLLNNAIQHNEGDQPRVWVRAGREGDTVVVQVADDGAGMPDEAARRLMGEAPDDLAEEGESSMGLHLIRTLLDAYGGSVEVEGRDPEGTVVSVRLPLAEGA